MARAESNGAGVRGVGWARRGQPCLWASTGSPSTARREITRAASGRTRKRGVSEGRAACEEAKRANGACPAFKARAKHSRCAQGACQMQGAFSSSASRANPLCASADRGRHGSAVGLVGCLACDLAFVAARETGRGCVRWRPECCDEGRLAREPRRRGAVVWAGNVFACVLRRTAGPMAGAFFLASPHAMAIRHASAQ